MNDTENNAVAPEAHGPDSGALKCEDIRELLTDYMTRELGDSRSALVREHLRKCSECQAAAREIGEAFDLLRADDSSSLPERLTDKQRARVTRALRHPIICWIEVNHAIVSAVIAIALVLLILGGIALIAILSKRPPETIIDIRMTPFESHELDRIEDREVPITLSDMPEPELIPLDGHDTRPPTRPVIEPPSTDTNAVDGDRQLRIQAHAKRVSNIRRNRIVGGVIIGFAAMLLGIGAYLVRRLRKRAEAISDGRVDEGPPPLR